MEAKDQDFTPTIEAMSKLVAKMYSSKMTDADALLTLYKTVQPIPEEIFKTAMQGLGPLESRLRKCATCEQEDLAASMLTLIHYMDLDKFYVQRFVNRCSLLVMGYEQSPSVLIHR